MSAETHLVAVAATEHEAEAVLAEAYPGVVTKSFFPDVPQKAVVALAKAQIGKVSPKKAETLVEFINRLQRDLGSIVIESALAGIPGHEFHIYDLRIVATESGQRRVIRIEPGEGDMPTDAELIEKIEAKFVRS